MKSAVMIKVTVMAFHALAIKMKVYEPCKFGDGKKKKKKNLERREWYLSQASVTVNSNVMMACSILCELKNSPDIKKTCATAGGFWI